MSEYWKSTPRKFCDFCKCWIADNKVSISFHESGKKHKDAVDQKLRDIRRQGHKKELQDKQEDDWIKAMEKKAMQDYRSKDLEGNSDLTAKIFNEKRAERIAEREKEQQEIESHCKPQIRETQEKSVRIVPDPSTSNGFVTVGPGEKTKPPMLRKIEASKQGTKWHKPPPEPTRWFEAVSEEGHRYYWNTETNESRWEPPAEGFVSIAEQEMISEKKSPDTQPETALTTTPLASTVATSTTTATDPKPKKIRKVDTQQNNTKVAEQGPAPRGNPYGSWEKVAAPIDPKAIDYEAPAAKEPVQPQVTLHSDRLTKFEEKKMPSLGGDTNSVSKPAIVFRKRRVMPEFTRKTSEDN